jgi:hypothetical protein
MNIRETVDASVIHIQWITDDISIEPHGLSQDTINNLIAMGYQFIVRGPIEYFGEGNEGGLRSLLSALFDLIQRTLSSITAKD